MAAKRKPKDATHTAERFYKERVFPALKRAGFAGTPASLGRSLPRHGAVAFGARSLGCFDISVQIHDGRSHRQMFYVRFQPSDDEATTAKNISEVEAHLERVLIELNELAALPPLPVPKTKRDALAQLVDWMTKDTDLAHLGPVEVEARGRTCKLSWKHESVKIHDTQLMTFVYAAAPALRARDLRFCVRGEPFHRYLDWIRRESEDDACALYVQIEGPYDLPTDGWLGDSLRKHKLADVFQSLTLGPKNGSRFLAEFVSGRWPLVRRVGAAYVVKQTMHVVSPKQRDSFLTDAAKVCAALPTEAHPLLCESAMLLGRDCAWLIAARRPAT